MKRALNPMTTLVGLFMFFAIWQVLAWIVHRPILPSPVEVVPLFLSSIFGELGLHFAASTGRVLAAIAAAIIIAVPVGLGSGQTPVLDRIFSPLIAIVYPIPKIVLLPVIYVLMGITDISKIFLIALIIFFQILVVVRDEAANLHPELILSVRSLGAGRRALFRFVYFPATLPAVLTALRISVGTAIAVLFYRRAVSDNLRFRILHCRRNLSSSAVFGNVHRDTGNESAGAGAVSCYFVFRKKSHSAPRK